MRIVHVEGPMIHETSFQPYMRLTLDLPLSLEDKASSEAENALAFYRSFMMATKTYHQTAKT